MLKFVIVLLIIIVSVFFFCCVGIIFIDVGKVFFEGYFIEEQFNVIYKEKKLFVCEVQFDVILEGVDILFIFVVFIVFVVEEKMKEKKIVL